jgi:hypothetical protein
MGGIHDNVEAPERAIGQPLKLTIGHQLFTTTKSPPNHHQTTTKLLSLESWPKSG